jgi:hypothetical protein
MSNLAFVLALLVFTLGSVGLTVAFFSISLNNKFKAEIADLEAQLALSKENHRRNGDIAKEYQIKCGDLEQKVEALEAWIASPPPAPTSKPAFAQDEDGIW